MIKLGGRKRNFERGYMRRNILEHKKLQPYIYIYLWLKIKNDLHRKKAISGTNYREKDESHITNACKNIRVTFYKPIPASWTSGMQMAEDLSTLLISLSLDW